MHHRLQDRDRPGRHRKSGSFGHGISGRLPTPAEGMCHYAARHARSSQTDRDRLTSHDGLILVPKEHEQLNTANEKSMVVNSRDREFALLAAPIAKYWWGDTGVVFSSQGLCYSVQWGLPVCRSFSICSKEIAFPVGDGMGKNRGCLRDPCL